MKLLLGILALVALTKGIESVKPGFLNPPSIWSGRGQRIVGGEEVEPNSIPYQAGLFVTKTGGLYFCGGSLISPKYVLTSASCIDGAISVQVRLGAHRVNDAESTQVRLTSTTFNVHHDWNNESLVNDIATIELPEEVTLNNNIALIPLPSRSQGSLTFVGYWGVVSGWGRDSDSATTISPVLRSVRAEIISNPTCTLYYGTYVTPGHICTSGVDGVGSCGGDSGGPLVVDNILVGIISYGSSVSCEHGWPSAYTRITAFFEWIENHSDVIVPT